MQYRITPQRKRIIFSSDAECSSNKNGNRSVKILDYIIFDTNTRPLAVSVERNEGVGRGGMEGLHGGLAPQFVNIMIARFLQYFAKDGLFIPLFDVREASGAGPASTVTRLNGIR